MYNIRKIRAAHTINRPIEAALSMMSMCALLITTSQMIKEARNLYAKYFPNDESRSILYSASATEVHEFIEETYRFLKKYSESPINATLEELKQ